ncbi:bifunctional pyr operon transcriptional regulator/uracil phosphoribosyltransferase PyrR [Isoalcanivorax indicus]|uniref:bifunctional pyr operon transcriptional regulator/uracil phosphoribosyltransferase PyrR n=1 Tax=Isoalcanivorax indicus TaxID=2202653 RepID=UPI002482D0B2|nr:bifunctional pyr operon transcriptional regulator/uracil phosphoribosyltransferase PyrR [Isoalcanivorax indicus]
MTEQAPQTHYTAAQIDALLESMAAQLRRHLAERGISDYALIGIHSGGAWVADALHQRLQPAAELGTLDISFYRDDFSHRGLQSRVRPTALPFDVDAAHLVLVDDALMSGRTARAALNELFDYGRPASVTLAVLFDIGRRELPISADICGAHVALPPGQRVELRGPAPLTADVIEYTQRGNQGRT